MSGPSSIPTTTGCMCAVTPPPPGRGCAPPVPIAPATIWAKSVSGPDS